MATKKISELTNGTLTDNDEFIINDGGTSRNVTGSQVKTYAVTQSSVNDVQDGLVSGNSNIKLSPADVQKVTIETDGTITLNTTGIRLFSSTDSPPLFSGTDGDFCFSTDGKQYTHIAGKWEAVGYTAEVLPVYTDRYVDPDHGSATDSGAGTEGTPWATLQYAMDTAVAGDRVNVKASAAPYAEGTRFVIDTNDGTAALPIIFRSDAKWGAILERGIHIDGVSHVKVLDFHIRDLEGYGGSAPEGVGVYVSGSVAGISNIEIGGNKIRSTGSSAILCEGQPWLGAYRKIVNYTHIDGLDINNNDISLTHNVSNADSFNEAITITAGISDVYVGYNHMYDHSGLTYNDGAVKNKTGSEGIDLKGGIKDAIVEYNTSTDMLKGSVYLDGGLAAFGTDASDSPSTSDNITIRYNSFENPTAGHIQNAMQMQCEGWGDVDNVVIHDNLVDSAGKAGFEIYNRPSAAGDILTITIRDNNFRYVNSDNNYHGAIRVNLASENTLSEAITIERNILYMPGTPAVYRFVEVPADPNGRVSIGTGLDANIETPPV